MKRTSFFLSLVAVFLFAAGEAAAEFKAGAAVVDVTPASCRCWSTAACSAAARTR